MNYWLVAPGLLAIASSVGHAVPGHAMYYRPIVARVLEPKLIAVFTAIGWIITLSFALAGLALIYSGTVSYQATTILLAGAQFLACALVYLALSLGMRRPFALPQWVPFLAISVLCALGARGI